MARILRVMRLSVRLSHGPGCLVVLGAVACAPASHSPGTTPGAPVALAAASEVAPKPPADPMAEPTAAPTSVRARPVEPTLGRFEPVLGYDDVAPKEDCLSLGLHPGFGAIAATPGGVWVVGNCGVRVRLLGGKLERHSLPSVQKSLFGGTCTSHRVHWSVWADSDSEAFLLSSPRCGPDPNAVWPNELERWDGRRWTPVRLRRSAKDHTDVLLLTGHGTSLYAVVEGDGWFGPPDNAIVSIRGTSVAEARSGLGAMRLLLESGSDTPKPPVIPYEHYDCLVAPSADELWVAGELREYVSSTESTPGQPERHVAGAVWHAKAGQWVVHRLAEGPIHAIDVAPDGTVFAAGDGLWRGRAGGPFERLASGWNTEELGYGAQGLVARSSNDVWVSMGCTADDCEGPIVLHYDGASLDRVGIDLPQDASRAKSTRRTRLAGAAGGPLWLLGENQLWRLGK